MPSLNAMWSTIVAVAKKEFLHVQRDRYLVRTVILIQLIQLFLLGFIDTTTRNLPMVVVDHDHSSYSRELVSQLQATTTFDVRYTASNVQDARALIRGGKARVGILIPPDFRVKRAAKSGASVLVLVDGSDATSSSQAIAAVNGLVAKTNLETLAPTNPHRQQPLSASTLTLFNPEARTPNFMLPGMMAIALQWFITLVASGISREREKGTLECLLMTPLEATGFMIGKLAPYVAICFANFLMVLVVTRWVFGVEIRGNIPLLLAAGLAYSLAILAIGLFIGARAETGQEVQQKTMAVTIPAIYLSGYIFPTTGLPKPLYVCAQLMPQTHFVELSRGLIQRSAHLGDMAVHFGALLLTAVMMVFLAVRRFRQVTRA